MKGTFDDVRAVKILKVLDGIIYRPHSDLSPTENEAIDNFMASTYSQHYFLHLGRQLNRHIQGYYLHYQGGSLMGLLAVRTSGKAHLVGDFFKGIDILAWLSDHHIKYLLLHEEQASEALVELETSNLVKFTRTSRLMTFPAPREITDFSLQDSEAQDFELIFLREGDISKIHLLYQAYMGGSVSDTDMERLFERGTLALGIKLRGTGELVGVAQLGICDTANANCFLFGVVVHPHWRRRGLAHVLVSKLQGVAQLKGSNTHLLTNDAHAIALYEKSGYLPMGNMLEVCFTF